MKRLLFLLALLIPSVSPMAAQPATIGYVDMDKVLKESDMGRKALAGLEEKYGSQQGALGQEEQSIRQLQATLSRDQALMSQAELDKRTGEIQQRVLELQKKAAALQQQVNQDQAKLLEEILGLTREVSAELARSKKLSALFERSRSGLLYIDDSLNFTDEVIQRLNARSKK